MQQEISEQLPIILNKAYFYLKFRPRTKKEVETYLQTKSSKYYHWAPAAIEMALVSLEENRYINDTDFIRWFVEQRNLHKPKSAYALKTELMRLGVEKDLIDQYFSEEEHSDADLAARALQSKWQRFSHLEKKERFEKAAAFLGRRGFSFEAIKKAIAQMEEKE